MKRQSHSFEERVRTLAAEIRNSSKPDALPEGSGRGLVIVAGGARMFTNAYVLLHVLRNVLRSKLPVELWYFGPSEVSPAMAALIEPFEVRLVDATPALAATGAKVRDGWQLKSFALAYSRFAEVLLLDADQVPISDPAACFDWPQYRETGAVFWPDVIDLRRENPVWALLGLQERRAVSLESGQLLVDRNRHRAVLWAALRLNEAADDLYQLVYGDKDTYLLAWEMLGSRYSLVPHRPYGDEYVLVQRDFEGDALLQHRTNAKWQYGVEPQKIANFVHEADCIAALAELTTKWSGRVFAAPDRPSAARSVELQVIEAGAFHLQVGDEPESSIEFRPHAEIGRGRAPDRRHWWVEQDDQVCRLVMSDGGRRNYVVERGPDHIWRGHRFRNPTAEVSISPGGGGRISEPSQDFGLLDELLRAGGVYGVPGYDRKAMTDALRLLTACLPEAGSRLAALASMAPDPVVAERLGALADAVSGPLVPKQVSRAAHLDIGYVRAELDG
jgi:hypothetical protein